jgi:hypothetical protein
VHEREEAGAARARQTEQQAADTCQHSLLAIGDHIKGARWAAWLGGLVIMPLLWRICCCCQEQSDWGADGLPLPAHEEAAGSEGSSV